MHVVLDKDGQELCRAAASAERESGLWDQGDCHVVTRLTAGQQVFVRYGGGGGYSLLGGQYSSFSGFLVSH